MRHDVLADAARDPRLCPGVQWMEGHRPADAPVPFTFPHDWEPTSREWYCGVCGVQRAEVVDRFRDWRWEQVMREVNRTLGELSEQIKRMR